MKATLPARPMIRTVRNAVRLAPSRAAPPVKMKVVAAGSDGAKVSDVVVVGVVVDTRDVEVAVVTVVSTAVVGMTVTAVAEGAGDAGVVVIGACDE